MINTLSYVRWSGASSLSFVFMFRVLRTSVFCSLLFSVLIMTYITLLVYLIIYFLRMRETVHVTVSSHECFVFQFCIESIRCWWSANFVKPIVNNTRVNLSQAKWTCWSLNMGFINLVKMTLTLPRLGSIWFKTWFTLPCIYFLELLCCWV